MFRFHSVGLSDSRPLI